MRGPHRTYELAKQLKNAGFPQPDDVGDKILTGIIRGHQYIKGAYIPTLSELIETCGNDFGCLVKDIEGWKAVDKYYRAEEGRIFGGGTEAIYRTPEQAVARLWLAINGSVNEQSE